MMSRQELKMLRQKLQEKLNDLNQGDAQTRLLAGERSADMVEDAQAEVALDLVVRAINNDWEVKNAVETALERMEIGGYGICESCEEEISPKRLQAVPWATRCAPCQSYLEAAEDEVPPIEVLLRAASVRSPLNSPARTEGTSSG